MPWHRTRQGEYIASIAAQYGLPADRIWNHPENAQLRQARENPNVLKPGDSVFIPERKRRSQSAKAAQHNRFRAKSPRPWLRLDVKKLFERDIAGAPCALDLGFETRHLTISEDGIIETRIPANLESAVLTIEGIPLHLRIGELDPIEFPSGQRERLRNLGYYDAHADEDDAAILSGAITLFQKDNDLKVSGNCDETTACKLVEIHGC